MKVGKTHPQIGKQFYPEDGFESVKNIYKVCHRETSLIFLYLTFKLTDIDQLLLLLLSPYDDFLKPTITFVFAYGWCA